MAYYTGTDVKVWICTEHASAGIKIGTDHELEVTSTGSDFTAGAIAIPPMGLANKGLGMDDFNISDITGVDLSQGAQDEEISYFGTKTPGKIETKADLSVTLTRKKSNKLFSTLTQGQTDDTHSYAASGTHAARHGLIKDSSTSDMRLADGTVDPKSSTDGTNVCYGYRVAIQLKDASGTDGASKDGTVVVLRNCTLGQYTTTLSNDSANEESIELTTMVKPLIVNGLEDTGDEAGLFKAGTTATPATDM
jgi:hypothetical protein